MEQTRAYIDSQIDRMIEGGLEITDREAFTNNILDFMGVVRDIESSNDNSQVNPDSGAAGVYQFLDDSVKTARNRAGHEESNVAHENREYVANISENPLEWDEDQAGLMFLAHAFGAPVNKKRSPVIGSDELFHRIGTDFDPDAQKDLYMNYHYRAIPNEATYNRATEKILENYTLRFPEISKNLGGSVTKPFYSDKRYLI
mgnify:CR=1 FL=1|jgi:hypothetical protein|tara:strand:- start:563 stop:1165 length:603 start_codon:yes stop_codon:yes gene_type:complete